MRLNSDVPVILAKCSHVVQLIKETLVTVTSARSALEHGHGKSRLDHDIAFVRGLCYLL